MKEEILKLIEIIKEKDNFLLTTHQNPDFDALGSLFGIGLFLEKLNKNFFIYLKEDLDEKFNFLPLQERIIKDFLSVNFENCLITDSDRLSRAGEDLENFLKENNIYTIFVDHHETNNKSADFNLVLDLNSTSEIIYLIFQNAQINVDQKVSETLLLGILGDTAFFTIQTSKEKILYSFKAVEELISSGADYSKIIKILLSQNFNDFKKELEILNRIVLEKDGILWLFSYEDEEVNVINQLLKIKEAKIIVHFKVYEKNKIRLSLRSKGDIDVSYLAQKYFNGGGHKNASGGTLEMDFENAKNFVLAKIREYLRENGY